MKLPEKSQADPFTGAGAGKFWGCEGIFPGLSETCSKNTSKNVTSKKKLSVSIRTPLFSNQSMLLGAIFAQIFREF